VTLFLSIWSSGSEAQRRAVAKSDRSAYALGQNRGRIQQSLWDKLQSPKFVQKACQYEAKRSAKSDGGKEEKYGKY
jgi:hypothetical protein